MNVFYLDDDFQLSAKYHVDSHIVKIPLECAQMMSTANRLSGLDEGYKSTHINHPMNVWVRQCIENWNWMRSYALALNEEWKLRFNHNHNHKAIDMILSLSFPNIKQNGVMTDIPLCMPEYCKINNNPVLSYRNYYRKEKMHLAKWKSPRSIPFWFTV